MSNEHDNMVAKIETALTAMRTAWSAILDAKRAIRSNTTLPTQTIEEMLERLSNGSSRIDNAAIPVTMARILLERAVDAPKQQSATVVVPKPVRALTPDSVLKAREEAYRDSFPV